MRLYSIDILRALTMFFMIWVNDFWTLNDVPKWLLHAKVNEDYLGFSDIIFPLFLFIVGLSIPFAIKSRFDKGHSFVEIGKHIIIRSFSLLLIGLFMVNYETAYNLGIPIGKYFWGILMALAIFLIWTDWKKSPVSRKWQFPLQILGFLVLLFLAMIYEGGGSGEYWMRPQWWGILGLIGWAYLVNAFIFLLSRGNGTVIVSFWLLFYVLSVWNQTDAAFELQGIFRYFSTIVQGTIPAFTASGMIASLVLIKWSGASLKKGYVILGLLGITSLAFAIVTRPLWGISKLGATPSWVAICSGLGFLVFVIFHYLADQKGIIHWAKFIAPAGTATL
ncbi:MAG: heparan-alpha-glucosaminide N-acetyltransferase domain-containing protein, partial [Arenibacter algicola]